MKKICIASDHAGFELKEKIKILLNHSGYEITDFGTFSTESVDYPDMVHPLASAVNQHLFKHGIIICGSGNGVSMVANKYSDVRCAVCWNSEIAVLSKLHNNSNILALPARFITFEEAENIVNGFLNTEFEGGRHQKRVNKIKIG